MLNHTGTVTIKTNRLLLRKFTVEDSEDMFNTWANDEEVCKYLTWFPHGTVENTKELLANWVNAYESNRTYNWAIALNGTNKVIGSISVVSMDDKNEHCEIGYCLGKEYWNKGITTEALKAVINHMILVVGMNRVQAKHDIQNPASGRVMQKAGMIFEGTLKQYSIRKDGTYGDMNVYAILKRDIQP
jgi:Acetyltransferase (GNAT) family.